MNKGVSSACKLKRLEGYNNIVKWLINALEDSGYQDVDLDEFIHDIAEHMATKDANQGSDAEADEVISEWSLEASEINNGGMEAQVRVILAFHGIRQGITLLNEQLREGGFFCDFPETLLRISERSVST